MAKDDGLLVIRPPGIAAGGDWGAVGLLGLVSLIWGAIFPLTHIVVHSGLTPIAIATLRLALAAIVMICVSGARRSGFAHLKLASFARLAPVALLLLAMPHLLMTWSQRYISSSQAVILMATVPLLTALFASIWPAGAAMSVSGSNRGFPIMAAKLLPGFSGVLLMAGWSAALSGGRELIGIMLAAGASASCAAAILMMSRLPPMPAVNVSASVCVVSALAMLPVFVLTGQSWSISLSLETGVALLFLGLVCTGLASMLHTKLASRSDAVFASLGFYLSPLAGLMLSAMLLGERIDGVHLACATLVLGSVYLVSPPLGIDFVRRGRVARGLFAQLSASNASKASSDRARSSSASPNCG